MCEVSFQQRTLLRLIARGMTDEEIADACVIEPATVRYRMMRLQEKIGVRGRVMLAMWGVAQGIVEPSRAVRDWSERQSSSQAAAAQARAG